jgi:hypothetical protein
MKHIHTLSKRDASVFLMLKYGIHIVKGYTFITSNMFEMQIVGLTLCHVPNFCVLNCF